MERIVAKDDGGDHPPHMALDVTPLERAVARLREGLARHEASPGDDQLRDGLIHRLELAYELALRTLRHHLREAAATPEEIDRLAFPDLIRLAAAQGLLRSAWPAWRTFREMRNRTSHAYDEAIAREVAAGIPAFLEETEALLAALRERARGAG